MASAQRFHIYGPDRQPIESLDDWRDHAPPAQRQRHWKDGRSAKELARRWVRGQIPPEIRDLLNTQPAFHGFRPVKALAETRTPLDQRRGNTRNHDLLVVGRVEGETVLLDVEGKTDEPFGETITQRLSKAAANPRSRATDRVRDLCAAVLGAPPDAVGHLRYQLLHAIAAAVQAAVGQGASRVAWIVHEFHSPALDKRKLARNAADLTAFTRHLGGTDVQPGILVGPLHLQGAGQPPVDLYIGKAVHELTSTPPAPRDHGVLEGAGTLPDGGDADERVTGR